MNDGFGGQDAGNKGRPRPQDFDSSEYLKGIGTNHLNAFRSNQAKHNRALVHSELGAKRPTAAKVQQMYQSPHGYKKTTQIGQDISPVNFQTTGASEAPFATDQDKHQRLAGEDKQHKDDEHE